MSPRHKAFDPSAVLNRAIDVFWAQGYEATSVQDLVDRMGINRFSLYDTFGDKHELFMAACHRYRDLREKERIRDIEHSESGLEGIRAFFRWVEKSSEDGAAQRGCLMTNSVVELAAHDADVQRWGREFIQRLEDVFCAALARAKERGEIPPEKNVRDLACFLVCVLQGIYVLGKAFPDSGYVSRLVNAALAQLE